MAFGTTFLKEKLKSRWTAEIFITLDQVLEGACHILELRKLKITRSLENLITEDHGKYM